MRTYPVLKLDGLIVRYFSRFIPMICIMGMIFYLSHQPGDVISLPYFPGIDKFVHAVAYGILAAAFQYGLQPFVRPANRSSMAVLVIIFCIVYGISDEYHQSFIRGRVASFWDVAADTVGALTMVRYRRMK